MITLFYYYSIIQVNNNHTKHRISIRELLFKRRDNRRKIKEEKSKEKKIIKKIPKRRFFYIDF
jgi:hypothetical protein